MPRDNQQALKWYKMAASKGDGDAQYSIGSIYQNGPRISQAGSNVSQDFKQAMSWYIKAAENGNTLAAFAIGGLHLNGCGTAKNVPVAIDWYTKAHHQQQIFAAYNLGQIYQDELNNLQKAIDWYQKSADKKVRMALKKVQQLNKMGYYAKPEPIGIPSL
jgi:TPR repeat protein